MATRIACNRQNPQTLAGYAGSSTGPLCFYQRDRRELHIQVVDPTVSPAFAAGAQFSLLDCSDSELRAVIAYSITGTEGDESEKILAAAYEASWTWDAELNAFVGEIDCNTAEVSAFLDEASSVNAYLEINLIKGGVSQTIYQGTITLLANADPGGGTAPPSLSTPPEIGRVTLEDGVGGVTIVDNVVTVSGLGLAFTPSYFLLFVEAPSDYGAIVANFISGSGSTDGFSAVLSAVPPVDTYKLVYIPVA
jgi:hypothetical protein